MIRINLARSNNYSSGAAAAAAGGGLDAGGIVVSGMPHPGIKVAAMLIFVILVYGYETYTLSLLMSDLEVEQKKAAEVKRQVDELGSVKAVVEDLIKEKDRLNEQLKVIRKISQKRAYKLLAIEKVQAGITEDLWLEELTVSENEMVFSGITRSTSSVQEIVSNISRSEFVESAATQEIKRTEIDNETFNTFQILVKVKN